MHVFYLCLDDDTPTVLNDSGLPSTIYGVDMRDVQPYQLSPQSLSLAARVSLSRGRDKHEDVPSMGAIGCALSHYQCWMHIVHSKIEYAYIFESDARMLPSVSFSAVERYVKQQLKLGYQYISLGYRKQAALVPRRVDPNNLHTFIQTHAQVVTYEGALVLLQHFFPIEMQVDGYIGSLTKTRMLTSCGAQMFTQAQATNSTTHKLMDVLNFKTHCPRSVADWAVVLVALVIVHVTVA